MAQPNIVSSRGLHDSKSYPAFKVESIVDPSNLILFNCIQVVQTLEFTLLASRHSIPDPVLLSAG